MCLSLYWVWEDSIELWVLSLMEDIVFRRSYLEVLLKDIPLDGKIRAYLEIAEKTILRLDMRVEELESTVEKLRKV